MTADEIANRIACIIYPQPDMSGRQVNRLHGGQRRHVEDLARDIAGEISRLREECKSLWDQGMHNTAEAVKARRERDDAHLKIACAEAMIQNMAERLDEANGEIERLRSALSDIEGFTATEPWKLTAKTLQNIAREALNGESPWLSTSFRHRRRKSRP